MAAVKEIHVDQSTKPSTSLLFIQGVGHVSKVDLPDPACRWVPRRKMLVAAMLLGGLVTLDEMTARYGISAEELANWRNLYAKYGLPGLRVTRIQIYGNRKTRRGAYAARSK
jgi:hypothetical protein